MFKVLGMMAAPAPKYRTDTRACSCPGFWYRRTCKHYRAYAEAVALVLAQDSANVTWDAARGGNGAVRGSHGVNILEGDAASEPVILC